MSINYVLATVDGEEIWAPIVCCDHCRQQITKHGNVLWDPTAASPQPLHAHKGACDRALEAAHPQHLFWEELSRWLEQLTNNTVRPGHRVRAIAGQESA